MEMSRELLSEVLGKKVIKFFFSIEGDRGQSVSENMLTIVVQGKTTFNRIYINIYELTHKCKEWALNKGFEIVVLAYMIRIYRNGYEVYYTNTTLFDLDMFFKSCEWILKEINK